MYAENYQNGTWFDEVIAKIKWCSFFTHTWYYCDNGVISKFNLISEHSCNKNVIKKTIQRMQ